MKKFAAYLIISIPFIFIYGNVALSFFIEDMEISFSMQSLLFSIIFSFLIMFIPSLLFVFLLYNDFKKLYFKKENAFISVLIGFALSLLFIFISNLILFLIGYKEENPVVEDIKENMNLAILILIPLLSSMGEETFFRGVIQNEIERKMGSFASILITSILFAIAHLQYKTILQVIMPFSLSILLCILMNRLKNIFAPISTHFFYNFINLLILYFQ